MGARKGMNINTTTGVSNSKRICLQVFRWVFVGFCVGVLGFSLALFIMSCIGYAQMRAAFDELQTLKRFDMEENQFFSRFRPEAVSKFFLNFLFEK